MSCVLESASFGLFRCNGSGSTPAALAQDSPAPADARSANLFGGTLASGPLVESGYLGNGWKYQVLLEDGGIVSLSGTAATTPKNGAPVTGAAYLATPSGSTFGGAHLIATQASR